MNHLEESELESWMEQFLAGLCLPPERTPYYWCSLPMRTQGLTPKKNQKSEREGRGELRMNFFGTNPSDRMHESAEGEQQSTCCFIGQKNNNNRPEGQTSRHG